VHGNSRERVLADEEWRGTGIQCLEMGLKRVFWDKEKTRDIRERKVSNFAQGLGDELGAEGVVNDVRCDDRMCGSEFEVEWRDEDG
jgi:hypothetical protein